MAAPAAGRAEAAGNPGLDPGQALRLSQAALGRQVGDHILLDRQGRPVALSSFRGKPLLVSFIYTGCFQICPATTRSLQEAVEALQKSVGASQFNVVSIGFNQPADSPQALKAFATQYGITTPNWDFLSPPAAIVPALTADFGFAYAATPAGFDHVLQVSVLDADGRIVRQIYGEDVVAGELGEPLKMLLAGLPMNAENSVLDNLMDRIRIMCTVLDPETGAYRVDYTLPVQIAGGATFFILMMAFFINEWRTSRRISAKKRDRGIA
ncbi:SCO family protein [Castellaniella defragrans]|jgi:protein SCO1/2|uniref:Protein SCO1/2 n=1 Tax=Castellaniella defragrans TaxID=75697 RepID=A0A7W9TK61_CASDE|nr:SCO family protein [Castellaniella defragrans]KAB0607868.1 SCO family protein [Castellaniella defragrans]MBB6082109.1 protein SCO1/2 [Castellaniella defragrans]